MRLPKEPDSPLTINILPTIDVIFAILAFFIVSTLFLSRSEALDVNLPQASTARVEAAAQITVTIEPNGNIALNRQNIQLENLQNSVRQLIKSQNQSLVIINADKQVTHGKVIQVMDRLRQIEGVKLAIAAENPN
ncbi:MAG: biopolymer transporter ExbD [Prochloraceae cyanobacterium]|nr:biopolymer transporter ExbD [Prochloraceae cyanobacterium]